MTSSDYFDAWWGAKVGAYALPQSKHLAAAALVQADMFPLVDLGSGNGLFLKQLEENHPGAAIFGVEGSRHAIDGKVCDATIHHSDVFAWNDFRDIKTATLIDVIEHLPDPVALLAKLSKAVENIIVACPNFNFLTARLDVLFGEIPFQNRVARGGHVYWCQHDALHTLFAAAGLRVVNSKHIYPRQRWPLVERIGGMRPSLFAPEFVFLLKPLSIGK